MTELAAVAALAGTRSGLRGEVVVGRDRVLARFPEMERLAGAVGAPVTARTAWIRAQLDAAAGAPAWFAGVFTPAGELVATAVVLEDDVQGPRLAGGGDGHRTAVIAVDEPAAEALGRAVAAQADRRGHRGLAGRLVQDEPRTHAFAAGLGAEVRPAPVVPVLVPDGGSDLVTYLSHGMRKTLRKSRNRLTSDARHGEVAFTRRDVDIVAAFPALERAYRARDERHGVPSLLDSAGGLAGWRARLRRLLEQRCLELATFTVDGELAAYVLAIPDAGWYRILDGRIDDTLARYAPGRLLEAAVLERALAGGRAVDWMTSVAPESLLAANDAYPVVTLTPR